MKIHTTEHDGLSPFEMVLEKIRKGELQGVVVSFRIGDKGDLWYDVDANIDDSIARDIVLRALNLRP